MFSAEPQPDISASRERGILRHNAAVFALKELFRDIKNPSGEGDSGLNKEIRAKFNLSEAEAQGAIHDAKHSLETLKQDIVLRSVIDELTEEPSE